jgi:Tfp pilus assembly protein PilN
MNIAINILPKELRAKPLLDTQTFALIVVVVLLAFGSYYFYQAKISDQNSIADTQTQITAAQQQTKVLQSNPDALKLINTINQLKAGKQSYDAFVASRMLLGNAMVGVYALLPSGVDISKITQKGSELVIAGTADTYTDVSDYGRALNNDPRFKLMGLPSFSKGSYTLTISVAQGGG